MTFTYTNDPANSTLDRVRVLLGDIDSTVPLVTDEVLNYYISENSTAEGAAADAADHLAAKYAIDVNNTNVSLSVSAGERHRQFRALAADLRSRRNIKALMNATILVGGISKTERDSLEADTDDIPSRFRTDMHAYTDPSSSED